MQFRTPPSWAPKSRLSSALGAWLLSLACITGTSTPTLAHDTSIATSLTLTALRADDDRAASENLLSADLNLSTSLGKAALHVHLEAARTPRAHGVSSVFGAANADAGSALDGNGRGRLQVSELFLRRPGSAADIDVGLLDPTSDLDTSAVANDEHSQFLGASFVNNPSIAFPDYALGARLLGRHAYGRYQFLLTGSHGLSDNPTRSYSELTHLDAAGKGVFAAAETRLERGDDALSLGIWTNTARHERLDRPGHEHNYGVYASADAQTGRLHWNLRLGAANERVSDIDRFAAVAAKMDFGGHSLGLALARLGHADHISGGHSHTHFEVYVRWQVDKNVHISPIAQHLRQPGDAVTDSVWISGIRLGLEW